MASTINATERKQTHRILSNREIQVLGLVLEGRSSKEIAQSLYLSKRTVDYHLASIYGKLNVGNRLQAVRRAAELGLVSRILA